MRKTWLLLITGLLLCLAGCAPEQPFRLHVIANSDSAVDQAVKLEVRDAVLAASADIAGCQNAEDAEAYVAAHVQDIEAAANAVLRENGMPYTAHAQIGTFPFPDREYAGVLYPAGDYRALRVVLGEGEGQNWWCVMFPPLCIVDTRAASDEDVVVRSALVDWLASLFGGGQHAQ